MVTRPCTAEDGEPRKEGAMVRLSPAEWARVDRARGKRSRAVFLRDAGLAAARNP